MAIVFMGGEMGAFLPSDTAPTEVQGTTYDASFARCSLSTTSALSYFESAEFSGQTDFWVHVQFQNSYPQSATVVRQFRMVDGSDVERIALGTSDSGSGSTLSLQYYNGSAWVSAGTALIPFGSRQHLDIHVVCNSGTGSLTLYAGGTERIASGSIDLSGTTSITKVRGYGFSQQSFAQVIVADESTIGWRLLTCAATGAGATTDWIGTYTEIDEVIYSDADFINSSTNDQVELFTHSTAIPAGYTIRAMAVTARAKRGASGPANLQLALRSGGTTYYSASKALGLGYGAYVEVWDDDPATAAAFTTAAAAAVQFGVRAKT